MNAAEFRKQAKLVLEEVKAAREALEAKGAFTDNNAATHLVRALEALTKLFDVQAAL